MPLRRRILPAVAAFGLVAAAAAAPSVAAARPSAPSRSITVVLRAPHPAALGALARAHGLTHRQRVARLARLVPTASAVHAVSRQLLGAGLRPTTRTAWSITASGSVSDISAAHLLGGRLPDAFSRYVAGVLPTTTAAPAFHAAAAEPVDGKGFRDAYTAKHNKPSTSFTGTSTIATLQLAGFASSDLATYAKKAHLPKIVGTSRYRPVNVDGGAGSPANSGGGDIEVALDQESILSTAPSASQRPYFAPNSNAGYIDVFANVFDDVVQNHQANHGGDPRIVALSTSWGGCEANYGAHHIRATETVIKAVVAAGVTVFAASGDDGIYDCRDSTGTGLGNSKSGVDFPASSPFVVGVGGTNLQHKGSKASPNNGHNWRETAWSCRNPTSCEGNGLLPILPGGSGGTGGGESGTSGGLLSGGGFAGFRAPAYQKHNIKGAIFGHQRHRMVPDIAADGDPQTGFKLFSSDSEVSGSQDSNGLVQVGGTSLSSPLSAALLTNTLASAGRHSGVGDIHAALYKAYRVGHGVFRDITAGTNGAPANRGRDPSVVAHRGYDTVSGLGAVLWPALLHYLPKVGRPHH